MLINESNLIADILRKIGTVKCIEKALDFEKESRVIRELNLRNMKFTPADVESIAVVLSEKKNSIQVGGNQ